jgi:5-methylcytosine-specific restriction endonuclease McrA
MATKKTNPLYLAYPDQGLIWSIPPKERYHLVRRYIYDQQKGICGLCGELVPFEKMHLDHIKPLRFGGEHSFNNLQITHQKCNQHKGPKFNRKTKTLYIQEVIHAKNKG